MHEASESARPSPDALLELAQREQSGRGRLKIFLGAAPGVGKTYEMLLTFRARLAEGVDAVAGIVETHGRVETEALLAGLEIIPRKAVDYKGRALDEMDLDAVLTRRPSLALVDELAHTNAPGSRHPKRFLDVEELLAAGIDVYTTLNIQHVESLNDVVAQITGIRVRETVPDSVLDGADDIEVIDLAPRDLMQRLREGKVYVPRQAERALKNYFSPGNLTALRELALRRTAQRVDEQLLTHMKANAIKGPWPAGERVLVCINEEQHCAGLVRYAKRVADRLRAPWTALYVETLRSQDLSVVERDRIADILRFAERQGGSAATLPGRGPIADDIADFARSNNFTQIVIGKSESPRWLELIYGSIVHDLLRRSGAISVHVIAGDTLKAERIPRKTVKTSIPTGAYFDGYGAAAFMTGAGVALAEAIKPYLGSDTVPLIFMIAVLVVAYLFGRGPSIFAALASAACYNYFFIPPLYSFIIADPINIASLFFFLFAALIVSSLTARVRSQADLARNRATITSALYGFSSALASNATLEDLLATSVSQIEATLGADVVIMLPDAEGQLEVAAALPANQPIEEVDLGAAQWSLQNERGAGRGSETLPGARRLFLPLRTERGVIGVVGLGPGSRPDIILTPDERRLVDALMGQAAVAIERVWLAKEMDDARVIAKAEQLRSALLTSLSHGLKTPLATITAAAGSLCEHGERLDTNSRREMAKTIEGEAARLSRFAINLLDMTRVEAGTVKISHEPADISKIIGAAVQDSERLLKDFKVVVDLESKLPLLEVDVQLMEQVFVNLLDNASKYAPPGSTITVSVRKVGQIMRLQVIDEGAGIPEDQLSLIFEKFHRVKKPGYQRAGTGLGLAICRGFLQAMGGTITAANRAESPGAVFTIDMPISEITPHLAEELSFEISWGKEPL